jgi:subtilase family serine protease
MAWGARLAIVAATLAAAVGAAPALAAAEPMHVTIVLKPRDPTALAAYAREVSTPGSSVYHAFLTPAQFAARFGASSAELRQVQSSMRSHGLAPGPASANRLAVPVAGSAGAVERAFGILLRRVRLSEGRRALVASAAPVLDRAIAGDVQAVIGLTSVSSPQPLIARPRTGTASPALHRSGDAAGACPAAAATAAAEGAYTDNQIASAYGFTGLYAGGAEGQGETVAVYELEPYDARDIDAYQSCYGTNASVSPIAVDGGAGSGGGSGEAALDIEQVIGLAPRATILVYEGPNSASNSPGSGPYDTLSAIITQDRAHIVSISWGQCEQVQGTKALNAEQTLFEEAATQGQSVVSATGDGGSEDCPNSDNLAVDDPGSQQFVTGVGGTSLEALGPPPQETVWNRPGASVGPLVGQGGAGGGGVSAAWSMPGYQANAAVSLNVIGAYSTGSTCFSSRGYCREVPDVSADADPAHGYLMYWNGSGQNGQMPAGWQAVGGTSAAAPLWAALLADADSSSACRRSAIGFANPGLYEAASSDYGRYFNDVTVGENDFTGAHGGLYPAGPGYDLASGLGSPKADQLAGALCADALRVNNPGTQISTVGQPVSLKVTTTALPGVRLHFYASKLPPGLSLKKSTGRVTGTPNRTGKWQVGVAALDQNLSLRAAFFRWRVVGAPTLSGVSLSGSDRTLSFTLTAGSASAPWLNAISIRPLLGSNFSRSVRVSVQYVGTRRHGFTSRLVGHRLRIALRTSAWRIRVTITGVSVSGRAAAAEGKAHTAAGIFAVMTTDSTGHQAWAEA